MKNHVKHFWITLVCCCLGGIAINAQVVVTNPSSCGLEIALTDNNCPENFPFFDPDIIDIIVNTAPGNAMGENVILREVRLAIAHEWIGDLDLVLVSPNGASVALSLDNGGSADSYGSLTDMNCDTVTSFSMLSCLPIEAGLPPYIDGPYIPEESLWNIHDGSNPNGIWKLQICDRVGSHSGTLDFIHLIFEAQTCLPLENLALINLDSTTAILDWDPIGDCETAVIEFGPPGFIPGTDSLPGEGQVVFAACPPFMLDQLEPLSSYEIYIRKSCSPGFSNNGCPITLETGCLPPAQTLRSHFDDETDGCSIGCGLSCTLNGIWHNSKEDHFDWFPKSGATGTQGTGPSDDVSGGGKYLYVETTGSACNNGTSARLISDCILLDKQGSDQCHLSFNYHMHGDDIGTLKLEAQDSSDIWVTLWSKSGNQGNAWRKAYVDLDAFPDGSVLQFRFVASSGNGPEGDIAIDEIVFYGSQLLGSPSEKYFADTDGDGYGNAANFIFSCFDQPPAGFVVDSTDCNDQNPNVNPGQEEIFCDNIDNNCNGLADDDILPQLTVFNDTICSGEVATLSAISSTGRLIFWFSTPNGAFDFVGIGESIEVIPPPNNTPLPISYFYYGEENGGASCRTIPRTPIEVVVYPAPALSVLVQPEICPNQSFDLNSIQIVDANFTGGNPVFYTSNSYAEEDRLDNTMVSMSESTTFYYEVENNYGCIGRDSVEVIVKPGPDLSFSIPSLVTLCPNVSQTISVIPSGGTSPYTYFWSTGNTNPTIIAQSSPQPGAVNTYRVTVTDTEGCFSVDSVRLQTANNIVSVSRQVFPVSDCGLSDGAVALTPQGTAPYSYNWAGSDGSMGSGGPQNGIILINGLAEGSYRITITDSSPEMCPVVIQAVVAGPNLAIDEVQITNVSCANGNDGSVCLSVSGSNPSFLWDTGGTDSCIDTLSAGIYYVTVSNANCELSLEVEVTDPAPLKVSGVVSDERCEDSMNGMIQALVFGGTMPYSYSWTGGMSGPVLSNLDEGMYGLTVTDENECMDSIIFEVEAPDSLLLTLDVMQQISCAGETDGYLQVGALGGTPPYHFTWSNGVAAPAIGNLQAGTYAVTVKDFNGCQQVNSFMIEAPTALVLSDIVAQNPSCTGVKDGSLEAIVSGGTPPYAFAWSSGANTALNNNIESGSYFVVVSDSRGCTLDTTFVVLESISFIDWNATITAPECIGASNGAIDLNPNGVPPFSFEWNTAPEDTLASISAIDTGVFQVTLLDAEGCIYDTSFQLDAIQVFDLNFELVQPLCAGESNGAIAVTVISGGALPYTYSWSNGDEMEDLFGVGNGSYVLTISDNAGCIYISDSLQIESPRPLDLQVDAIGNIVCNGDSTAFIELTVEGGVIPYSYEWSGTNADTDDIFNLPAGTYQLEVLDANNCPIDTSITFTEPEPIKVDWTLEVGEQCEPSLLAEICPLVSGGIPPYSYTLEGAPMGTVANPCFSDLLPGEYVLVVEDSRGCIATSSTIKIDESGPVVRLDTFYTTNLTCYGEPTGTMTAEVSGGSGRYEFHFTPTYILDTLGDAITIGGLAAGTHFSVTVTDLLTGCSVESDVLSITQPSLISVSRDAVIKPTCAGDSNGAILATVSGGTPPYTYRWLNASMAEVGSTEDLFNVPAGNYTLEVTDSNGCIGYSVVTQVPQGPPPVNAMVNTTDLECRGGADGILEAILSGGTPPYEIIWSNGDTSVVADSLSSGVYSLSVTDDNGCMIVVNNLVVEEPEEGLEVQSSIIAPSCNGFSDGRIDVLVEGGQMPYIFSWWQDGMLLGGEDEPSLENIAEGSYELLIVDDLGCELRDTITVEAPESLTVDIEMVVPDPPQVEGMLTAIPEGGTPEYSFIWNTGDTTASVENIIFGATYNLTVTDANGCVVVGSILVTDTYFPDLIDFWNVFPNPTAGEQWIELHSTKVDEVDFVLYDYLGREVKRLTKRSVLESRHRMDLQSLSEGAYWLTVWHNGQLLGTKKVLKLRD